MQTFLPYESFTLSASVLDRPRLGKQRVENLQIMKVLTGHSHGWRNHPAVKMWSGCEATLMSYQTAICNEWTSRGYKDTCLDKTKLLFGNFSTNLSPWWLGEEKLHSSHRSNLLRKNPEHYSQFNWTEPDNLEYFWPTKE